MPGKSIRRKTEDTLLNGVVVLNRDHSENLCAASDSGKGWITGPRFSLQSRLGPFDRLTTDTVLIKAY